jgi:glycerophosphoryl diester phosphodiesterase
MGRSPHRRIIGTVALTLLLLAAPAPSPAQEPSAERPTYVIAHRGASHDAPEHTFFAFDLAVQHDADFLECDLQLSADDVLVCVHDATVDRTSNGTGAVSEHTLAELRTLDWGSWFNRSRPDRARREYAGAAIVPLEELLDCYRRLNPRLRFHIETKSPADHGGRMEQQLVAVLARRDLIPAGPADPSTSLVVIQSFERASLDLVKSLAPSLPTAWLWAAPPLEALTGAMPPTVDVAAPNHVALLADPTFVARAHANGHEVHTWTVDDPEVMDQLLDMGVDGIFTNRPDVLRARLDARGAGVPTDQRGNPTTFGPGCPGVSGTVGASAPAADPRPVGSPTGPGEPPAVVGPSSNPPATGAGVVGATSLPATGGGTLPAFAFVLLTGAVLLVLLMRQR